MVAIAVAAVAYRDQIGNIIVLSPRGVVVKCERVIDGDSLLVNQAGQTLGIRLAGIDCPEFDQPYGNEAKSFTAATCENEQLRLKMVGHDKYGRQLARAFVNDNELNAELVKAGLAWQYGDDSRLSWLEQQARTQHIGIWSQPNPVPPWEWRSAQP